jgi:hypothetical protein
MAYLLSLVWLIHISLLPQTNNWNPQQEIQNVKNLLKVENIIYGNSTQKENNYYLINKNNSQENGRIEEWGSNCPEPVLE